MRRRDVIGLALGSACSVVLARCGGSAAGTDAGSDAGRDASSASEGGDASSGGWATGGTSVIGTGYPDSFTAVTATSCSLICQTTIGPCHTTSPERADVSDGWNGLPVQLSLRVLDEACSPVRDAIVEIWHTHHHGIYSGNINTMCNRDAADRAAQYFRGFQRTDANGRVTFKTCFPGWYSSRTVHIHVRVMSGTYQAADGASATVITQLVFDDTLVRAIFASEPLYRDRGQPDTFLASDNVVGAIADRTPYVTDVTRASDGVMLASKTLIVKGTGSTGTLCSVGGMGGMGGG